MICAEVEGAVLQNGFHRSHRAVCRDAVNSGVRSKLRDRDLDSLCGHNNGTTGSQADVIQTEGLVFLSKDGIIDITADDCANRHHRVKRKNAAVCTKGDTGCAILKEEVVLQNAQLCFRSRQDVKLLHQTLLVGGKRVVSFPRGGNLLFFFERYFADGRDQLIHSLSRFFVSRLLLQGGERVFRIGQNGEVVHQCLLCGCKLSVSSAGLLNGGFTF